MKFEISKELAQAILDYLSRRPYVEVVQLINGLTTLKEIKEEPKE
jgi:hypothetical protein